MIVVVVPTIRENSYQVFLDDWKDLFLKHNIVLITVYDGENPLVQGPFSDKKEDIKEIMGEYFDCIYNFNGGIRNLGFAYIAKYIKNVDIILTLDDDLEPVGDTIQDHLDALGQFVPVSWLSTASEYMRGFPYEIRKEAEVVLSHGVWEGVADWDAPTQLIRGNHPVTFYKGPIPKGIYYPMCSMNLAFKRKMLPYMYHAPATLGVVRANDIFCGITSKREIDKQGWAAVTGYATVNHRRASNVFKNLQKEAVEIELNETYWKGDESDPYFKVYQEKYKRWQDFISKYV